MYAYLDSTKVLETGTDDAIAKAKQAYWAAYKANWGKNHRKATIQFTIAFSEAEAIQISVSAKQHKRSRSRFIKESCMAYINKSFLFPDQVALGVIKQSMALNYHALQKLFDANVLPFQVGRMVMLQMTELEQVLRQQLHNPKTIEQMVEEAVKRNPEYKEILIRLLKNIRV